MDPNAALTNLRSLLNDYNVAEDSGDLEMQDIVANDIVEVVRDLDAWISSGGFLPQKWLDAKTVR